MTLVQPPNSSPYTLRQLECFVAIADAGTIAGAAQVLHASDSAVGDALTALERALGVTLFHRQRARGVILTSDGLAVLPSVRRLLMDAEGIAGTVGHGALSMTGVVRVGAAPTLAPVVLGLLIAELRVRQPGLRIEFVVDDHPALALQLADGALDLFVSYDVDVPPELSRAALYETVACVVLSVHHPLAARRAIRLSELVDEPMVLLDVAPSRVHTLELMSSAGLTPSVAFRTSNYELCRSLVARNLGYTLLMWRDTPRSTWDGGEVAFVPIHPSPREVGVLALWRTEHLPGRAAAVVETLRDLGPALGAEPWGSR